MGVGLQEHQPAVAPVGGRCRSEHRAHRRRLRARRPPARAAPRHCRRDRCRRCCAGPRTPVAIDRRSAAARRWPTPSRRRPAPRITMVSANGPVTPTPARSAATPGTARIASPMPPMRPSSGSVDPTSSTSASPTSHNVPLGKTDRNVATIDLQIAAADVVGVRPLAQHAAGRQPIARALEKLPREERRDAGHPRVRRLRDDHVVRLPAEHQVRAAVADDQARARIGERAIVLGFEKPRRLDHALRDLQHVDFGRADASAPNPASRRCPGRGSRRAADSDAAAAAHARAGAASACRRRSTRRPCRRWPGRWCRPAGGPPPCRSSPRDTTTTLRRSAPSRGSARASPARTYTRRSRAARDPIAATRQWPPPPHRSGQSHRTSPASRAACPGLDENRHRNDGAESQRPGGWCRAGRRGVRGRNRRGASRESRRWY